MERELQITKLVNVLRRTAQTTRDASPEAVAQAATQFNRVRTALIKLDPEVGDLFESLEDGASDGVVTAACRHLAAYYDDEVDAEMHFDADSIKDFWSRSAQDIEEVGDFIRESFGRLQRDRKSRRKAQTNGKRAEPSDDA